MLKQITAYGLGSGHGPAAFGRLCVETIAFAVIRIGKRPAAFGRLCVETTAVSFPIAGMVSSRLRAAVC